MRKSKNLTLDCTTFERQDSKLGPEQIKNALNAYKVMAKKERLEIVRGPFATIQARLFEEDKVDIIVRALVRPARKTKKSPEHKKAGT